MPLQKRTLKQLHVNHMSIEKTRLLACESIHSININADIENATKNCPICLDFQMTQPKDKMLSHKIPGRPWGSIKVDIFLK